MVVQSDKDNLADALVCSADGDVAPSEWWTGCATADETRILRQTAAARGSAAEFEPPPMLQITQYARNS